MKKIKERITDYWTLRAEGFEAQRLRELESAKREIWLREIKKQLPGTKPMRVLDISTGTGFSLFQFGFYVIQYFVSVRWAHIVAKHIY